MIPYLDIQRFGGMAADTRRLADNIDSVQNELTSFRSVMQCFGLPTLNKLLPNVRELQDAYTITASGLFAGKRKFFFGKLGFCLVSAGAIWSAIPEITISTKSQLPFNIKHV